MIVKVPVINAMGKTDGCEKGPNAILQELEEFFTNEDGKTPNFKVHEIKPVKDNLDQTNQNIFSQSKKLYGKQQRPIFVGGDHSISYPLVKSFFSKHPDAGLLILDAHADCMHNINPPTHEDWLRTLIEEGIVDPKRVLIVGLRNMHKIEIDFLDKYKINSFSCKEIINEGIDEITQAIMGIVRKWESLYISLDIDIVDPAFAPSVSYPEPGGLTSRELLHIIHKVLILKNLKAADVVEVNPVNDTHKLTTRLGSKLALELLG